MGEHDSSVYNHEYGQRDYNVLGYYLNRVTKQFVKPNTGVVLTKLNPKIPKIESSLFIKMLEQRLPLFDNFNEQIREKKLMS